MAIGSYKEEKCRLQKQAFAMKSHRGRVAKTTQDIITNEKINNRVRIIRRKNIRENGEIELPGGCSGKVRIIKSDGIIILEDLSIIDPLDME